MLSEFFHFFGRCIAAFVEAIGTTLLGLILGLAFTASTAASTIIRVRKEGGWSAVLAHLKNKIWMTAKIAMVCACIIYIPAFLWVVTKEVYLDHTYHVTASTRYHDTQQAEKHSYDNCRSDLRGANDALGSKTTLADSFQKAFLASQGSEAQQSANIATCTNMLGKMNPKVAGKHQVILYSSRTDDERKLYDYVVFIVTNQDEPKAEGDLQCDKDVLLTSEPEIVTPSGGFQKNIGGQPNIIGPRQIWLSFQSTASFWGPTTPIAITLRTPTAVRPKCTFSPK